MSGDGANGNSKTATIPLRRLGGSGLWVSELGLGAMTFSIDGKGGWGLPVADETESFAILDAYVAAGGNFIDTADVYGTSEELIGRWLQKKGPDFRKSIIIATKYGNPMGPSKNDTGSSRKHIHDAVEASLKKMQTTYIDLYQQHVWSADTPLIETMFALNDLVTQGKVRYIGASNFASWQFVEANHIAKEHHLTPFISLQQQYSLLCRSIEWDIVDALKKDSMGILPWSPLAGGFLSGRYTRNSTKEEKGSRVEWAESVGWSATNFSDNANERAFGVLDELEKVSKEVGQSVAVVSLRWLLHKTQVSSVLIGARNVKQLQDNVKASHFTLTDEQVKRLDKASQGPLPYPYSLQHRGIGLEK